MRALHRLLPMALILPLVATPAVSLGAAQTERIPLSDEALADQKGGFLVAQGVTFDFGAVVRTFVDGQLALQTSLNWTPSGPAIAQTIGDSLSATSLDQAESLMAKAGLQLEDVLTNANLRLEAGGGLALIHKVVDGQPQSYVFNTASGQDIRQQIDVTITLPGFETLQQGYARDLFSSRLGEGVGQSTIAATAH